MPSFNHHRRYRGMSLAELLVATAVMGIIAASMATLSSTVFMANDYAQNFGGTAQYARVALQRIENTCQQATATADYPGFWTPVTSIGSYDFPDVLIVWKPETTAANPAGPPLFNELVCFTYDPASPSNLVELRDTGNTGTVPAISATSTWLNWVDSLTESATASRVVLAKSLRLAKVSSTDLLPRACIRFETRFAPTFAEWSSYQSGSTAWEDMNWPQNIYSTGTGLRQSICFIELQMSPLDSSDSVTISEEITPYFGSAVLAYGLER